jgi:GT2 family glycosyltransferase
MKFGVVVIGRNEGERLERCLTSITSGIAVAYVDSGSTDGSSNLARNRGVDVVDLDMSIPFTAARARNAGFRRLRVTRPELAYVQFVDGDCELSADWPDRAISFSESHTDVGAVCGHLRERDPDRSIYNWLCDQEWAGPAGEIRATGGIVMVRADAFEAIGGYRDDVIAAEDDELSIRMRSNQWRIWRLDCEMGIHDAAMTQFGQWWQRAIRAGYAFAQVSYLHRTSRERYFVWESRRAWLWGLWIPLACLLSGLLFGPWGWVAWLIFPLQILRQTLRNSGPLSQRATLSAFQVLARVPESWGQIRFWHDRLLGRQARIIEHK